MSINQDLTKTNMTKRQGLIIYLNNISNQYKLRRYGDVVYFSKKMGYCILYVNQKAAEEVIKTLSAFDFVERIEKSTADEIDLTSSHIEKQISDLAAEAEAKLLEGQENDTEKLS